MLWKFFFIVLIIWLVIRRWQKSRLVNCCKQFKNDIRSFPLIGHTYMTMGDGEVRMKAFKAFGLEAIKQGGMTTVLNSWLFDWYFVVVAEPQSAEFILKNCLEKDPSMQLFSDILGDGLLALPVPEWRPRRKVLNPAFCSKNLNQFVDIFRKNSNILVEKLRSEADMGPFSVYEYTAAYTLDSVCETMLGTELGCLNDNKHPLMEALNVCCEMISNRICLPWLHNKTIYEMTSQYTMIKENAETLFNFIGKFIPSTPTKTAQDADFSRGTNQRKTMIQLMIDGNNDAVPLTKKYLMDDTFIVTMGAMDTTALTISYVLKLLARNPDIQEKVYDEITAICGSEREIQPEDLPSLKYLEFVIKETLRLYPPGAVMLRNVDKDIVLPNGKTLVKGIGVAINAWAVHRHPGYWGPDAEVFRPERWEAGSPHPGAFLAFSAGARNCIGSQYAMMSLKTALSTILRSFRVTPAEKYKDKNEPFRVTFDIMMRDAEGFQIQLKSR